MYKKFHPPRKILPTDTQGFIQLVSLYLFWARLSTHYHVTLHHCNAMLHPKALLTWIFFFLKLPVVMGLPPIIGAGAELLQPWGCSKESEFLWPWGCSGDTEFLWPQSKRSSISLPTTTLGLEELCSPPQPSTCGCIYSEGSMAHGFLLKWWM